MTIGAGKERSDSDGKSSGKRTRILDRAEGLFGASLGFDLLSPQSQVIRLETVCVQDFGSQIHAKRPIRTNGVPRIYD